jgi:hypothetical protein
LGFDLIAKRRKRGAADYYASKIQFMVVLRSAMVAAGVEEGLVYKKFIANDHWLVSARESRIIAERLTTWLQGRNLVLNLAETNERAHVATDALSLVLQTVGKHKEQARLARHRRATSLPFRVDRTARKAIREFAAFCAGSGGFYVS